MLIKKYFEQYLLGYSEGPTIEVNGANNGDINVYNFIKWKQKWTVKWWEKLHSSNNTDVLTKL